MAAAVYFGLMGHATVPAITLRKKQKMALCCFMVSFSLAVLGGMLIPGSAVVGAICLSLFALSIGLALSDFLPTLKNAFLEEKSSHTSISE